jgi:hypothetical protein
VSDIELISFLLVGYQAWERNELAEQLHETFLIERIWKLRKTKTPAPKVTLGFSKKSSSFENVNAL